MGKIVLNNGTEIEGATISEVMWAKNKIFVSVPGNDVVSATVTFGNPENSRKMEFYNSIYKDIYYNYTIIDNVGIDQATNSVTVWMSGAEGARHEREHTIPEYFTPENVVERLKKETEENGPANDSTGSN